MSLTDEWMNKCDIHARDYYYSALKGNEILTHSGSEISQSEKNKYCVIPLTWGT